MELPRDYYHCFLGNGTDAVLIGYTGSMVPDGVSNDRCYWYKSDRYYPEDRLVKVVDTRDPDQGPVEHVEGSGWFEIAPLGRTWYQVLDEAGEALPLQGSEQRFVPSEGTLYTKLDYGTVKGEAVTWLHATRSLLVERYTFDREIAFRAWMAPGVWVGEGWDTDPFRSVAVSPDAPEARYDLGETRGFMALRTEPAPASSGGDGDARSVTVRARSIVKYFMISDDRQGPLSATVLDDTLALGYDHLRDEHVGFWATYFAASRVSIPDEQFQHLYDASAYHFRAMQSRVSGGLPVNNLRRPWSSHIFWDAYFLQRPILAANHRAEALEASRFFQRTLEHARRHAADEFGSDGLKWDWEITHDGRAAYGTNVHQRYQVHNNGSYSNLLMNYYDQTQDADYLAEFYPILEGLARFFLHAIVQTTERGLEVGYLVDAHESPVKVRNAGANLAAAIAILRNYVRAAEVLGITDAFTEECAAAAGELSRTLDRLFNGRHFMASEDQDEINMGSLTVVFPQGAIDPLDPRAGATVDALLERYAGRMLGSGVGVGSNAGHPWAAGVTATILAREGRGDLAWQVIESMRPSICAFGGMAEAVSNGHWNMQYFGTAQGAVCGALQEMLLQGQAERILLFPALPGSWESVGFQDLLASGFEVSATLTPAKVEWAVRNVAGTRLSRQVRFGDATTMTTLEPGETARGEWSVREAVIGLTPGPRDHVAQGGR